MIFADTHVHIYNCYDFNTFLESALTNFNFYLSHPKHNHTEISLLCLTETKNENEFNRLKNYAREGKIIDSSPGKNWSFQCTEEDCSLQIKYNDNCVYFIIAGSQIVAQNNIEVLAIGTVDRFEENLSLQITIQSILDKGAIPVIPYGFGKWTGRRGKLVMDLIKETKHPQFFLGDNGGYPHYLPKPPHFRQAQNNGIRILPGSDPLPFVSESTRPGSFGFSTAGSLDPMHPAGDIVEILLNQSNVIAPYGYRTNLSRFIINQLRMQIVKRWLKKK